MLNLILDNFRKILCMKVKWNINLVQNIVNKLPIYKSVAPRKEASGTTINAGLIVSTKAAKQYILIFINL